MQAAQITEFTNGGGYVCPLLVILTDIRGKEKVI